MTTHLAEREGAAAAGGTVSVEIRQLLMQFTGALNRRRAYAAVHPMVQAAEQQLFESVTTVLRTRAQLTIGVAKTDLLLDGEPYVTTNTFARELATRLHRRGVGALAFSTGVTLVQVRETLAWLASEPDETVSDGGDDSPRLPGVTITRVAYGHLTMGDAARLTEATGERLWRSLAQLAGHAGLATDDEVDLASPEARDETLHFLRGAVQHDPVVARRTATALQDVAAQATAVSGEVRRTIGDQLNQALGRLGSTSFGPILRAIGERSAQHAFVAQVVEVLPAAAIADWLQVAAQSSEQQVSHHLLRLMAKLSSYAETSHSQSADQVFRGAAQDIVRNWMLDDPNPAEHVALLDRIATHERAIYAATPANEGGQVPSASQSESQSEVESARLVQMALEIDAVGDDVIAAAEALVCGGHCIELLDWGRQSVGTQAAIRLRSVALCDTAVKALLLAEPVDRLRARALLEQLDASAAGVLIDVLAVSEARGTRLIVRQRLAEFGAAILPVLLARLDAAPWFLIRNILTLLHEIARESSGTGAALENLVELLEHPQMQVRIEAFRLLILDPRAREAAIRRALGDDHDRLVILALQALTEPADAAPLLSPHVVTQLIASVESGAHNEPIRARMVRALAFTNDAQVRAWLVNHATRRSRILRRIELAEPTPVAIAAVYALRRSYADDTDVQRILAMVSASGVERLWQSREPAVAQELVS